MNEDLEHEVEHFEAGVLARHVAICKRRLGGDGFITNPRSVQEKIAHIKLFGITKLMTRCSDKLAVRDYAREVLGEDISVPVLGSWRNPHDIEFDSLPDKYVLKCNHGSGYNIVVEDASSLDRAAAVAKLSKWLSENFATSRGETQYLNIPRKCFAEAFVDHGDGPVDLKFVCLNGEPKFVKTEIRGGGHIRINWYDMDFRFLDYSNRMHPNDPTANVERPKLFDEMREVASKLAKPFDLVRVDFLIGRERFYLGELTFTPGNGKMSYVGDPETGLKLGSMLRLTR